MKNILQATLLIAPVLGQISDPLRYVDPLIGSSNGGTVLNRGLFPIDYVQGLLIQCRKCLPRRHSALWDGESVC